MNTGPTANKIKSITLEGYDNTGPLKQEYGREGYDNKGSLRRKWESINLEGTYNTRPVKREYDFDL